MDLSDDDEEYFSADEGKAKLARQIKPETHSTGRYYIGRLNDPFDHPIGERTTNGDDRIDKSAQKAMRDTAQAYANEPRSYHEAMHGPDANAWRDSIDDERNSLLRNKT